MRNRADIMGVLIDKGNLEDALKRCVAFLGTQKCNIVITPNTEIVMEAQKDLALFKTINEADLVIPDGIGLIYASKIRGKGLEERVTGVDLMHKILKHCNDHKKSIYILGGKPGVAEAACKNIKEKFSMIGIKGFRDGYFKTEDEMKIIENINACKPDILFLALGAPKQELWMGKYKEKLQVKLVMGVGGSVDIWAGTAKRAPEIYQKLGLEWFYRLAKEPWRYKRMLALPKFMIKVLLCKQ
ncbi:WecB/TagA/CpsF family glycosyltransferase [Marinisporobacter balticus]|uniref:N-acetylglucosaminyldiphosphoundecaprenol N-acetyl-beta-D-mannosaminyltransferase n=1 Tax=Marinisporobacter balticus TaxID=2018667 RepID=A0A4R2L267_9FIRM|nr:WecB/TagA/CpsF family glycosyltransferase [Marinisporobacter balticus]TCO73145.1 N-acetylmannosaminyltransferase [Marinisporobacter balticus]